MQVQVQVKVHVQVQDLVPGVGGLEALCGEGPGGGHQHHGGPSAGHLPGTRDRLGEVSHFVEVIHFYCIKIF